MHGRALIAASVALIAFTALPVAADALDDCLAQRRPQNCIVELTLAEALAKADPMDRVAGLTKLASVLAAAGEYSQPVRMLELADKALGEIADADVIEEARFALVEARAKVGDFDGAFAELDRIEDPARRQFALSTIAVTAGELAELDVLERLLPTLEDQLADEVKEDIAEYFHQQKNWDRLIEITSTLVFWTPDLARWVLADLVSVNRFPDALHLYELVPIALKDFGARGLVDGFLQVRNFGTARQIALTIANRSQYHSDAALADIAEAAASAGDRALADSIIAAIVDGETKGDALVKLASALAERGETDAALAVAQAAAANPPPMRSPVAMQRLPRLVYASIAQAQARRGNVADALATIRKIDERTERDAALEQIANTRAGARDYAGALLALNELTAASAPTNPTVLRDTVRDFALAGEPARAVALAQALPDVTDRVATLTRAAEAVTGRPEVAHAILDAAAQGVEAIPALRREVPVARIAVMRGRAGDGAGAAAGLRGVREGRRTDALLAIAFPRSAPLP